MAAMHSVLKNVREVHSYPWPHVVVKNAVDYYDELATTRPDLHTVINGCAYGENTRYDLESPSALKLPNLSPVWREFIEYHSSADFWRDIVRVFGEHIAAIYPDLNPFKPPACPKSDTKITIRCKVGVNTPTSKESSVRGLHVDSTNELVAGLLYMPLPEDDAGGELEIHELTAFPQFRPPAELLPGLSRYVKTVPYKPNTLFMFINTDFSIHSVTPRKPTKLERRFASFAIDVDRPIFNIYGPPELVLPEYERERACEKAAGAG